MNLLTTIEEKSATMASYRMLALCHLLHDEMCIDSLLEEPCMYNRVLLQCLISASSNWHVRNPFHQCSTTSRATTHVRAWQLLCLLQCVTRRG